MLFIVNQKKREKDTRERERYRECSVIKTLILSIYIYIIMYVYLYSIYKVFIYRPIVASVKIFK